MGFCYADTHVEWFHKIVEAGFDVQLQPRPLYTTWAANWDSIGVYASVLGYPLAFVFVPTLLMGASFPLIASLALRRADREGKTVGTVYFFNILGNVTGGILTGYWLLAHFGTERTALAFSIAGLAALFLVDRIAGLRFHPIARIAVFAGLAAAAVLTFPGRGEFYGLVHGKPPKGWTCHIAEGVDAVVVTYNGFGVTNNYINGLSHGDRPAAWYTREAFEAFSYAPQCRDVLVIGFGAGTFVENALWVNEVEHVTLVEISDTVMSNYKKIPDYRQMLLDPPEPDRLGVVIDDGRRFLLRTDHKYDMILIDPLRTTTSYSNNLYSREFFELVHQHLKPEGLFLAWMDDYWVFPQTLSSVFPKVREYSFGEYMGFCMASDVPVVENKGRADDLFEKYPPWMQSELQTVASYLGDESYIREHTAGCPMAHDWKPVMEYYFWREFQHAEPGRSRTRRSRRTGVSNQ